MATKVGNLKPEDITLLNVNVLNVNIEASEDYMNNPVKIEGLKIKTGSEIALNVENQASRIRLYFDFNANNNGDEEKKIGLSANIGLEFHFHVKDMDKYIDEKQRLDLSVAASLINISYSTSRGIILEKTQNTFFHGIILPVVDSTKLLPHAE